MISYWYITAYSYSYCKWQCTGHKSLDSRTSPVDYEALTSEGITFRSQPSFPGLKGLVMCTSWCKAHLNQLQSPMMLNHSNPAPKSQVSSETQAQLLIVSIYKKKKKISYILSFVCLFVFQTGFLCSHLSCPGTHSVDQAGLRLTYICLPLPPKCRG